MKILFVNSDIFLTEPVGLLYLSAVLKRNHYDTSLTALRKESFREKLDTYNPDVIAYSAMSPEARLFINADAIAKKWIADSNKRVLRIMGGPHPTYFPEVLEEMGLDAIGIGECDTAILEMVRRFEADESLDGIPNVVTPTHPYGDVEKELIHGLDELPFIDRDIYYNAMPLYRHLGLKGFMTGRGCPYNCSYCQNHAFKAMFKKSGRLLRRRTVGNVIAEMKHVIENYPPVKLIKISDDTFAHKVDDWLVEFLDEYKKEIGVPFYCLMRSNTLSENMARRLKEAGCISICMAVESGNEKIRNDILKRGLTDEQVINSFAYARKYGMKTYGNTLLAIPGTTFEDDFNSFLFTRKLKMTAPSFGIFNPYKKTELTDFAEKMGLLDDKFDSSHQFGHLSALNSYTDKEKIMQLRLAYLAPLFCALPAIFIPLLRLFLQLPLTMLYKFVGTTYMVLKTGLFVFPGIYPMNPVVISHLFVQSLRFFIPSKSFNELEEEPQA